MDAQYDTCRDSCGLDGFTGDGGQLAQSLFLKPDPSWISISGTAAAPRADVFTLDYGDGTVTVEMDDWDWYNENLAVDTILMG